MIRPNIMRVAAYYSNHKVLIEEKPIPEIGEGELLIKNRVVGICGSDVTEWYRIKKVGSVLGHEIAGEVVQVGAGVTKIKVGDRVSASHHVPCYRCHYCQLGQHTVCDLLKKTNFDPGGFSEYIRLPKANVDCGVYRLPDHVSYDEATFIEPVACALRAQKKIGLLPIQTVLILGCGIAGILHLLLAKNRGVRRVIATDIVDFRLELAKKFGADYVFRSSDNLEKEILKVNEGRLPDVIITCSENSVVIEQALKMIGCGGTVLFFALANPDQKVVLPLHEVFWKKGATLMNSYAASPEDHREALELIQSRGITMQPLVTHRFPLHEIGKGFEMVANAGHSMKVIIDITH